ncbi:hypothetical protein NEOLEDRAFT_805946 [Neolentinus lepideus HHB14362 ss-1]|uniref:Uncharacterized protein n=1 Tax=Neolentinus lepideus HHB14362 ss-1 TaxID=1314782 RepID=A0A165PFV5_9AGAM|nr:hypothetical protein NEOLEDRAFT_805946 [Neolentinus lepideus HHB14362 ss-1]
MPNNQRLNKVTSGRHVKRDGFVHVVKPRVPQNPDDDEQTHQKTIDPVVPQLPPAPTPTPSTSTTSSTSTSTSPTPTTTSTSSTTSSTSSITSTSSTSTSTSTSTSSSTSSSSTSTSTSSSTSTSTSTSTTSSTPVGHSQLHVGLRIIPSQGADDAVGDQYLGRSSHYPKGRVYGCFIHHTRHCVRICDRNV